MDKYRDYLFMDFYPCDDKTTIKNYNGKSIDELEGIIQNIGDYNLNKELSNFIIHTLICNIILLYSGVYLDLSCRRNIIIESTEKVLKK